MIIAYLSSSCPYVVVCFSNITLVFAQSFFGLLIICMTLPLFQWFSALISISLTSFPWLLIWTCLCLLLYNSQIFFCRKEQNTWGYIGPRRLWICPFSRLSTFENFSYRPSQYYLWSISGSKAIMLDYIWWSLSVAFLCTSMSPCDPLWSYMTFW